jgi:drug/metabolite transporter (DMT)-like permease
VLDFASQKSARQNTQTLVQDIHSVGVTTFEVSVSGGRAFFRCFIAPLTMSEVLIESPFMSNGVSVPEKTADSERWTGMVFTFLSTLLYATSNVAVRYLTTQGVDNDWILFYKETVGFSILLPWLFLRLCQGRFQFTSRRLMFHIILAAILCQLIGARLHVLGFAVIGLVITVPLIQSSTLLGVAMIGHFLLGEKLSRRRRVAISILIVALVIISVGKELAGQSSGSVTGKEVISAGYFLLVAAGTVVAGISYAVYIVMLRYAIRKQWRDENSAWLAFKFRHWIGHDLEKQPDRRHYSPFPVTLMMSIVLATGMGVFGVCLFCKYGIAGFYEVPDVAWNVILISGVANMAGFFFQIQGLRMTSAVQASLIAVSQIILMSLIGYLFFDEVVNSLVMVGLGLTIYGVFMSAKPERGRVKH